MTPETVSRCIYYRQRHTAGLVSEVRVYLTKNKIDTVSLKKYNQPSQ